MPVAVEAGGVVLAIRATPRAARTAIEGVRAGADGRALIALRVASPPVDGAANDAIIGYLAATLGVPRSRVALLSGATGRVKRVRVEGDGAALAERVRALIEAAGAG